MTDTNFSTRIGALRKQCSLIQQAVAALALNSDLLLFEPNQRGPESPSLRLHVKALHQLHPDERGDVLAMSQGALLRHQVRQLNVR